MDTCIVSHNLGDFVCVLKMYNVLWNPYFVTMNQQGFVFYFATSLIFVMEKGQDGIRRWGGRGTISNLSTHMTRSFLIIARCVSHSQPWISILQYFIKNVGVKHRRTIIKV